MSLIAVMTSTALLACALGIAPPALARGPIGPIGPTAPPTVFPDPSAAPPPFEPGPPKPMHAGEPPVLASPDDYTTSPISPLATCTPRLALLVSADARFNLGGNPDATTCGAAWNSWDLMFSWPGDPWSSFTTARIDGSDWVYGTGGYTLQSPYTSGYLNYSAYLMGDIAMSQSLELVPNDTTGDRDVLRITYTMTNWGSAAHTVGLRSMIDTELDYNDGAIFRADGVGIVDHEREFRGSQVPTSLQTLYSASDTVHVGTLTLRTPGATPPDRVVIAQWPRIQDTAFDYWPDPSYSITGDSALGSYWYPAWLEAGATRTFTLSYGRGTTGSAAVAVSPSEGSWYGGNEVTISVPGLAAGTTPYVTFGSRHARNVAWGTGWVRVVAPSLPVPHPTATPVEVAVHANSGDGIELRALDAAYTYRGLAVLFIRGINSTFDPADVAVDDAFASRDPDGIYAQLTTHGITASTLHQFSYSPTSPSYMCPDTYWDPVVDAANLARQINELLVTGRHLDVYLIGHSKGGIVALTYLALLQQTRLDPDKLAAATANGYGDGRLAGIVTLDSPVGGIDDGVAGFRLQASLRCLFQDQHQPAGSGFMEAMSRLEQSAHGGNPLGSNASILGALFRAPDRVDNQDFAEAVASSGPGQGPAILTIGNIYDAVFNVGSFRSWLPYTTQWMQTAATPARVWARAIAVGNPYPGIFAWANHGFVTEDPTVAGAIAGLLRGLPPPTGPTFNEPPHDDPLGASAVTALSGLALRTMAAAATPGITGTVTAGGAGPVAHTVVLALSATSDRVIRATAADDGTYSLATGTGTFVIGAYDPSDTYPFGFAGDPGFTTQLSDARRVTVGSSPKTVDIELPPGTSVTGTATIGSDERASVIVEAVGPDGHVVAGAVTSVDASYTLVVPDGTYVIRALGGGDSVASAFFAEGGAVPDAASATSVEAAGSPVTGIDIDLPAMGRLTGAVTDAYSDPLSGVFVTATAVDGSAVFSAITAGDGSYTLAVDPGLYDISFTDPTALHQDGLLGPSGWVADEANAQAVEIGFADVPGVSVSLPFPDLPGAPTGVTAAQAPAGRAWVDWVPPADTGGAAIDRYYVVSSPGNLSCFAYAFPGCMVDGLQPGVAYSFQVWAANATGWGPVSTWSTPLVVAGPPGVPDAPIAIAGNASATIWWSAPAADGGSPITGYTVTSYPEGKTCATGASTTQCTITGLSWYEAYTFTVTATNLNGEGQPSNASDAIWPLDLTKPTMGRPAASVMPWVTLSGSKIPVRVTLPAGDTAAGSGICSVQIARSTDGGHSWSAPEYVGGPAYGDYVKSKGTIRYRARSWDCAGNTSGWVAGPTMSPRLVQDKSSAVHWRGKWIRATSSRFSSGTERFSRAKGASVTVKLIGRSIALVGTIGSGRGKARIYVGSQLVATVDLGNPYTQYRTLLWQKTWSTSAARTIRVVVVGTSGRPRVDVDAFAVLK